MAVHVHVVSKPDRKNLATTGADLLVSNDLHPETDLRRRVHTAVPQGDGTLFFCLHGMPEWALGGNCRNLKLLLPDNCRLVVTAVELLPATTIAPTLNFPNSGYLGSKGFIHMSADKKEQAVTLNATTIDKAAAVELEVTRPNLTFEEQNSSEPSSVVMRRLRINSPSGAVILHRSQFPATGLYEARPRALDTRAVPIGVAGDHIVISVDS